VTIDSQSPYQESPALFPAMPGGAPLALWVSRVPVPDVAQVIAAPDHGPGIGKPLQRTGPGALLNTGSRRPPFHNPGTSSAPRHALAKPGNGLSRRKMNRPRHTLRRPLSPFSEGCRRPPGSSQLSDSRLAPLNLMTGLIFVKFFHFTFHIKWINHFSVLPLWWVDGNVSKLPLWKAILRLEKFTVFPVNPS
jgi:hypothetical protein